MIALDFAIYLYNKSKSTYESNYTASWVVLISYRTVNPVPSSLFLIIPHPHSFLRCTCYNPTIHCYYFEQSYLLGKLKIRKTKGSILLLFIFLSPMLFVPMDPSFWPISLSFSLEKLLTFFCRTVLLAMNFLSFCLRMFWCLFLTFNTKYFHYTLFLFALFNTKEVVDFQFVQHLSC